MLRSAARLRRRALQHLRVDREPPQNVMIHDDGEEHQKEDQSDLNVAFLKGQAEIAAQAAFDGEEQDVATVENGNRKQVQDAEVHADQNHKRNYGERATLDGFVGFAADSDGA